MKLKLFLLLVVLSPLTALAYPIVYPVQIKVVATVPTTCTPDSTPGERNLFYVKSNHHLYVCTAANTLTDITDATTPGEMCTLTAAAAGDVLTMSSATACINATPGIATSRTDATGTVTLSCSTDRNKVVVLTNATATAAAVPVASASCPDGMVIFIDNQSAAGIATITPTTSTCNGAATCQVPPGAMGRLVSDGSNYQLSWSAKGLPRSFGATFDGGGSALVTGTTYLTLPFNCSLNAWDITTDTGTATFTFWRLTSASTTLPVVGNTLNTAGIVNVNPHLHSTTLTDFAVPSTAAAQAFAVGDVIAVHMVPASSPTFAQVILWCKQ